MSKRKTIAKLLTSLLLTIVMVAASSCVGDQSVAKRKGIVEDFSTGSPKKSTCGETYFIYEAPYDSCITECSAGYHLASTEELEAVKKELTDSAGFAIDGVDSADILARVNGAANICIVDEVKDLRPTNAIDIKNDFCSCINGKSDVINDCDAFCALKPVSDQPILYVNTTPGPEIVMNTKLQNVYNWCTVQLTDDQTQPQCSVSATDGTNTLILPANVSPGSNSFNVNILSLAKNRTWILKLVESKAGSNAQSKEFQLRRKDQSNPTTGLMGALKVTPINQYTCLTYGGKKDEVTGNIFRTSYGRVFYYFSANENPPPISPAGGTNQSQVVCHDEQLHPGADSIEYDRLELIPGAFSLWDKSDPRFVAKPENQSKLTINIILQERLASDYQINGANISLFSPIQVQNRPKTPTTASVPMLLGYMMIPFSDADTGKTYCPNSSHYSGNQPLLNLLSEYMGDTEGIYLAEKEVETVQNGNDYVAVPSAMFVRESTLKEYGFYIENGLKIKANPTAMNTKTIYYYWPTSSTADPLIQGNRKLFTVRSSDTINGNVISAPSTTERTTDKRIGCVPKI